MLDVEFNAFKLCKVLKSVVICITFANLNVRITKVKLIIVKVVNNQIVLDLFAESVVDNTVFAIFICQDLVKNKVVFFGSSKGDAYVLCTYRFGEREVKIIHCGGVKISRSSYLSNLGKVNIVIGNRNRYRFGKSYVIIKYTEASDRKVCELMVVTSKVKINRQRFVPFPTNVNVRVKDDIHHLTVGKLVAVFGTFVACGSAYLIGALIEKVFNLKCTVDLVFHIAVDQSNVFVDDKLGNLDIRRFISAFSRRVGRAAIGAFDGIFAVTSCKGEQK